MNEHSITKKIYYHDTDCGGVVYYGRYLEHLEEGRAEYCQACGVSLKDLIASGTSVVVAHVEIRYKSPARYQDIVKVTTQIERIGNSSVTFFQRITRGDSVLVEAKTVWVCVGKDLRPKPVPDDVAEALRGGQRDER